MNVSCVILLIFVTLLDMNLLFNKFENVLVDQGRVKGWHFELHSFWMFPNERQHLPSNENGNCSNPTPAMTNVETNLHSKNDDAINMLRQWCKW